MIATINSTAFDRGTDPILQFFTVDRGRGRESFSANDSPHGWFVARKRLPTPCSSPHLGKLFRARCYRGDSELQQLIEQPARKPNESELTEAERAEYRE